MLSKEARILKAKYMRDWRKKNPDKQKEYTERAWEKKAILAKLENAHSQEENGEKND